MSYTTNTASEKIPMTYSDRRREIEQLLKLAEQMEAMAFENSAFKDDPAFQKLERDYRVQCEVVHSLSL